MFKDNHRTLISLLLLIGIFSFSYYFFSKYQPKSLRKVEEVKGLSNINTDDIPYPIDAVKIGYSQTPKSSQTTFKTSKTQSEVWEFYKNIYGGKDWKLISERQSDGSLLLSYRKDKETVNIVVTQEEDTNQSVVSIEMIKK